MPSYCIIYHGLHPGFSSESYARVYSALQRLPARQLPLTISAEGMILATGLSLERAHHLQMELQRNGCLCEVVEYEDQRSHADFSTRAAGGLGAFIIVILLVVLAILSGWAAFTIV